jgi:hypothetical protein
MLAPIAEGRKAVCLLYPGTSPTIYMTSSGLGFDRTHVSLLLRGGTDSLLHGLEFRRMLAPIAEGRKAVCLLHPGTSPTIYMTSSGLGFDRTHVSLLLHGGTD